MTMFVLRSLTIIVFVTLGARAISPEVQLGETTLIGRDVTFLEQDFFGGIPFAEPPLGNLRLQPPVLKMSLDATTFDASNFGSSCLQPGTPIVYVNFNYRLGPLGFPQGQEAADRKVLNLALHDQIAALTWVQENIGAFGGDKNKIIESGSAASALTFDAQHRQVDWDNFVAGVPGCVEFSETGNTFNCLQSVNTTAILSGLLIAQSEVPELFPWSPTIDGEGGFMPELPSLRFANGTFAKIPFISGTNLDEELITEFIIANYSPPAVPTVSESQLENATARLLELYPDVPALGSPFNTGNDTFGLSPGFKRICALFSHASEIPFVYGAPPNATASATGLSEMMIDYWVSFATSLNPNDGKGIARPTWEQYTPQNQAVIQLNGDNTTMIPDDYRKAGIDFINSTPLIFHH
ncbi:hypothetical protein HHX47_DHR1000916 [Lentinula edodes]|nr:hypothetical protein HHX47_DHR1000916 [Lentinula edodes]